MSSAPEIQSNFQDFNLSKPVMKAVADAGYETPTPIQSLIIPHVLSGRDVMGQAQTGTGKTAAFALPLLTRIDVSRTEPQVLVLTPTRELAIQVAEAFQTYAAHMKGFHVLPVYGGQGYELQLRPLKRGVHVVVGTPGRVMDHIRRETLNLKGLSCLVLDEADEMLRMGFIDDVEWIMEHTPPKRQVALFSATIPAAIRRIAQKHLNEPLQITTKVRTTTADTIRHRYWMVSGIHKLDALTRILESETFDGIIVFVRTKSSTTELSERLQARGYSAAPLSGDISQSTREKTIAQLKAGKLDILVATDVAARGLDVDRISHVINYDIPYDTESYVHRVGRTGRAGRTGDAILFVAPRERHMLGAIEKATRQKIDMMQLPSTECINNKRIARFKQRITDTLSANDLGFFSKLIANYRQEHNVPELDIAAALAKLLQGDEPLLLTERKKPENIRPADRPRQPENDFRPRRAMPADSPRQAHDDSRPGRAMPADRPRQAHDAPRPRRTIPEAATEKGMERFRIAVGRMHGVKPANIVGAIANEAGLESKHIGRIDIYDDFSTVDLPEGMPKNIFNSLKKVWVAGQELKIAKLGSHEKQPSVRTPQKAVPAEKKDKMHARKFDK
jgi:ATP-dependent RNA helicase DeaD